MRKIQTLKEIKDLLTSIPDEALDKFGIGYNGEGGGEVTVVAMEEDMALFHKYPQAGMLGEFIQHICAMDKEDDDSEYDGFFIIEIKEELKGDNDG